VFLYTNNELSEREIKKTIPFTVAWKRIKYLVINLTKEVKDCALKTMRHQWKPKDTNKWKDIPCSWVRRTNIVKMSILPNRAYRFNAFPIKISMAFFHRNRAIIKFVWNHKRSHIAKLILRKNKAGDITVQTVLQSYYNQNYNVFAWNHQTHKIIDECNRIEGPELNLCIYGQLVFNEVARNMQRGKNILFNKWCWKNWIAIYTKEWNWAPILHNIQ